MYQMQSNAVLYQLNSSLAGIDSRTAHITNPNDATMKAVSIYFSVSSAGGAGFSPLLVVTPEDVLIVSGNWSSPPSSGIAPPVWHKLVESGKISSIVYLSASQGNATVRIKIKFTETARPMSIFSLDGLLHYESHGYSSN